MIIAFDGSAFCRDLDSMDRVLRILIHSARHAGWEMELWAPAPLRPDAQEFAASLRIIHDPIESRASVAWSPEMNVPKTSIPTVATVHDINPLLADGRNPINRWRRARRFRKTVDRCIADAHQLATDTEDARSRILERFPRCKPEHLNVIPLFADPEIQPIRGEAGASILSDHGISPGFILFVGSLRRHKNWEGLIRAYASLPESLRRNHTLVFAGRAKRSGDQAKRLAASLNIADRVIVTGSVDEQTLRAFYGAATLLACPSFMEGFGFPPLEAMACGVPVVATDRTCVPEVLGDAPVYIDPYSLASICGGLQRVLEDKEKRETMIGAGFERATAYGPERTAAAMQQVITQLT